MTSNWHLSKTVTIGNMLTMAFAIMALVGSYYTMDKRVTMLEVAQIEMAKHQKADTDRVCKRLDQIHNLIMSVHFNKGEK